MSELENPMEKERMLLAAFQRGDNETGCKIINELVDNVYTSAHVISSPSIETRRIRAMELTVLLSRAAMAPKVGGSDVILKANNRNLRRIQKSKTKAELIENLHRAAEQMAGKIFSFQGLRHASALCRAQRYIWENFTRKISLEEISRAGGLSAPYFSTVFREEMGENLSNYLNRLRVEKAAVLLTETANPLNIIADRCGFRDQSWFSKIFKIYIGVSPGKYRKTGSIVSEFLPEDGNETKAPFNKPMETTTTQHSELSARIRELKEQYKKGSLPPEYPLDKEQKLLDSFRRGDSCIARSMINEILADLFYANPGEFEHIRFRAIELAFLLSRLGLGSIFTLKTMLKNHSQNLLSIEKTNTVEELAEVLHGIAGNLEKQIRIFQKTQHAPALKKAEDYIQENFAHKISLKEAAKIAGLSPPYFSTVFKNERGENFSTYINRLRVEKAAVMLEETNFSLCKIALACGFQDQSWFSKIFKNFTGKSPGKFRRQGDSLISKQ